MTKRKNPKPPQMWGLQEPPGGTRSLSEGETTVKSLKGKRPQRRDPVEVWLESKLPRILKAAELPLDIWTGEKLGQGSFGLVYKLADGRVFKLGFDYSESWFLHNLERLVPFSSEPEARAALPRIDHYEDISRLDGWEDFIFQSGGFVSDVEGPEKTASAFVCIREDVRGLADGALPDKALIPVLNKSAKKVKTSMKARENSEDPDQPTRIPDLREGFYDLDNFSINGRPKDVGWRDETPAEWEVIEEAQLLVQPMVELVRHLANEWEIFLPDARAANVGFTDRGGLVLRDLGFVYAPQYHEWTVKKPREIE